MPRAKSDGKPFPHFESDEEMERFVASADLSEYDVSGFKPIHFYLQRKDARVNMRIPESLLNSVKTIADEDKVPYQRLIRDFIERGVQRRLSTRHAARKKAS